MTRHFGMFQFKETITNQEIEECFSTMQAMVGKIPGLLTFLFINNQKHFLHSINRLSFEAESQIVLVVIREFILPL